MLDFLKSLGPDRMRQSIGPIVGALFAWLINLGLPAELATDGVQAAVTVILIAVFSWLATLGSKPGA